MAFSDVLGPSVQFKTFGEALKYWRKKQGWTLNDAAKEFGGVDATSLSRIERGSPGRYKPPETFPTAFIWAARLGLDGKLEDHAHFIKLAMQGRHEPAVLDALEHDSDLQASWRWFSRRGGPPLGAPFNARRGIFSIHECIGRVAEVALAKGRGDLGFRAFGSDGEWEVWTIKKPTPPTPKKSRKKGGSKRRSK